MTIETDWKGDNCYENIGKVYFSKESRSRTSEHTFTVEVNKCPPGTERPIDTEAHDPVEQEGFAGEMQQAFVDALRARGLDAGPEHVTIIKHNPYGSFFRFALRVSRDGCLLPHMRAIARECIRDGSQKGAKHLLVGSIQRAAGKTRVVPRTVVVETGVIESVGKGTSDGTGLMIWVTKAPVPKAWCADREAPAAENLTGWRARHRHADFQKSKWLIRFIFINQLPGRPLLYLHHCA
jgi:hypothetical protein